MTYNTGNAVPSTDPRDLDDNAEAFDRLLNTPAATALDRLGAPRKTWWQMEQDAAALVSPNVSALAAATAAVDKGVFFNSVSPVGMGTYTLTSFSRGLGAATDGPSFRAAISAMALTDTGAYAGSAAKLTTARTLTATGDATWSVSFDGSAAVTAALTLAATGVTAGTYGSVTVNAKGLVTAASTLTPIANGGTNAATAAAARTNLGAAASGANADITGLSALVGTAFTAIPLSNSWVATSGSRAVYRKYLGMLQLEVNITGGTITDGTIVGTLPAGFRVPFAITIPVASAPNVAPAAGTFLCRAAILTDGTIRIYNCGSSVLFAVTLGLE